MKNKKACIITLYGNNNYGNKLQNYALQTTLEKIGFEVKSLRNVVKTNFLKEIYHNLKNLTSNRKLNQEKTKNFINFNHEFMNYTDYLIKGDQGFEKIENFDKYVVGSDQVWNHWNKEVPAVMFAPFATKDKVLSYSASFAIPSLESRFIPQYKIGLSNFSHISVREDAGAKIVKEVIDREVPVTLDPTLLLTSKDWEIVEKPLGFDLPKNYLVSCFIGNRSLEQTNKINEYAKQEGLEVIYLYDASHPKYYTIGPSEFLYLFHHAKMIMTDSFHACVFSYIYQVPFLAFNRLGSSTNMNSRINTLLRVFDLNERHILNLNEIDPKKFSKCDFTKAKINIEKLQKDCINYLTNALE